MSLTDNEVITELKSAAEWFAQHGRNTNTAIIGICNRAVDLINRQKAKNKDLFYKLEGVMHSVDKWLDGDELKQDEVNRAATMREKTLQIMEQQKADVDFYKERSSKYKAQVEVLLEQTKKQKAEIEKLELALSVSKAFNITKPETVEEVAKYYSVKADTIKAEAIKEFWKILKRKAFGIIDPDSSIQVVDIADGDNLIKEVVGEQNG